MRVIAWLMLIALGTAGVSLEARCDSHESVGLLGFGTTPVTRSDPHWTPVEQKAWTRLSVGQKVDLLGPCPDWWATDAEYEKESESAAYTLSGSFITQLMTEPRYQSVTENFPIVISGALVSGDVLIHGGSSGRSLTLMCSVIEGDLRFAERDLAGQVNLYRMRITGDVEFSDVRVASSIGLLRSDVGTLKVLASRIDGSLAVRGTRVRQATQVLSTVTGRGVRFGCPVDTSDPRMDGCLSRYGETDFKSVQIGGLLEMSPSMFLGKVRLQSVDVGLSFVADSVDYRDSLSILDGTFNYRFQMVGSTVHGVVFAESMRVGGSLSLRNGSYEDAVLRGAKVGGDLDFRASLFGLLDLTGTVAGGELRLASGDEVVRWRPSGPDVRFNLTNTRVQSLQDTQAAWPEWLTYELDGFEYEKLGGLEVPSVTAPYLRSVEWFKQWLAGDESYSPQPYRQLSMVLRGGGQTETANAILYEAKERERTALPLFDGSRVWLELLRWTIGYGIGLKAFRALAWMALLCIVGWIIAARATCGWRPFPWTLLWYSASHTVPGFTIVTQDRVPVPRSVRHWFYCQRLLCYGLALFAAAAAVGVVRP